MKAEVKRQKWGEDTMVILRGENRQATIEAYYWFWHYGIAGLAPDNELLNWRDDNVVQFQTNEAKYVKGAALARLFYLIDNEAARFKGVKGGAMAEARQFAQDAYNQIVKIKKFEDAGVTNFGAISLTQIPGDPDSIKGNKARGVYWTKPDKSGKEVSRDVSIDESSYSEFIKDYENTYFKEVYDVLSSKYKLGRIRILLKEPRSTLSWHKDPECRLHVPIITNPGCSMVIENVAKHLPADGRVWITNNTKYHNFFNGGEQARIHLVACVLDSPFK